MNSSISQVIVLELLVLRRNFSCGSFRLSFRNQAKLVASDFVGSYHTINLRHSPHNEILHLDLGRDVRNDHMSRYGPADCLLHMVSSFLPWSKAVIREVQ